MAKIKPIDIRINNLYLRHRARAIHSTDYHPLNKLLSHIETEKHKIRHGNYHNNPYKAFKNINNHPLQIAFFKSHESYPAHIFNVPEQDIMHSQVTAPANFQLNTMPSNYTVNLNETPIDNVMNNEGNVTSVFLDGSCVPNPGKGASAYVIPKK
eukprot:720438_1